MEERYSSVQVDVILFVKGSQSSMFGSKRVSKKTPRKSRAFWSKCKRGLKGKPRFDTCLGNNLSRTGIRINFTITVQINVALTEVPG